MPMYDYECSCGLFWEEYNDIENRDKEMCACGLHAKRIFKLNAKPIVLEYYSEGLGERVTGLKHKARIMKEKNLREVDRAIT